MFLYEYSDGLYLNITNRCPVSCAFCVKRTWNYDYRGQDLNLAGREPTVREIVEGVSRRLAEGAGRFREIVFCGYGEPTLRLDAMNAVGLEPRLSERRPPLRLNTVGLGSLVHGRDIVPELKLILDSVSVSLNTADPKQWLEMMRPAPPWREKGFQAVKDFAARCVAAGLRTRVTAVDLPGVDLGAVSAYARSVGAEFLARPPLD